MQLEEIFKQITEDPKNWIIAKFDQKENQFLVVGELKDRFLLAIVNSDDYEAAEERMLKHFKLEYEDFELLEVFPVKELFLTYEKTTDSGDCKCLC